RLGGPGHQLTIEADPFAGKLVPESRRGSGAMQFDKKLRFGRAVIEEAPSCAGVDDSNSVIAHAKALQRRLLITTDDNDRARAHVFFFADHSADTIGAEVVESLQRMFEQSLPLCRLR